MRRLLFTGLISVADASNGISEKELDVFEQFFGKYAFTDKLDVEKIKQTLDGRINEVNNKTSTTQAMQVLHDMCVMAKADGGVSAQERTQLEVVARGLGIPSQLRCQSVGADSDLD
ncbi:MAG: tellurite resistance protein [Cryomorphaceae bacterium]|jgi:tellurite resistance protein